MRKLILVLAGLAAALTVLAQTDRREVRSGNRDFKKGAYREAEIDYRKAVLKDSLSMAGQYNLASDLYMQENYSEAAKTLDKLSEVAPSDAHAADWYFNKGDVALKQKDYAAAAENFKQSLLLNPGDMEAKENYVYARMMQKDGQQNQNQQEQNQDGDDDRNQQNQDQNKDQQNQDNQNQNNQPDQDNQNRDGQQPQPSQANISPQQAQQMLRAIQAKEKETQDKVNKEKAALLKSRQKDKNW